MAKFVVVAILIATCVVAISARNLKPPEPAANSVLRLKIEAEASNQQKNRPAERPPRPPNHGRPSHPPNHGRPSKTTTTSTTLLPPTTTSTSTTRRPYTTTRRWYRGAEENMDNSNDPSILTAESNIPDEPQVEGDSDNFANDAEDDGYYNDNDDAVYNEAR